MKSRLILIAIILVLTALMGFTAWYKIANVGEPPISEIDQKIHPPAPEEAKPKVPDLVHKVNQRNAQIRSLRCDDMDVRVWENGMRVRLSGEVYYEKDLRFRMFVKSVLGKELDMGSNDTEFWYWSRRSNPSGVYWAKYEDFFSTRLKTPFNPVFLRASFGVDILPIENAKFVENEKGVLVVTQSKNSMGKVVNKYTFINKQTELIEGYLIVYEDGTKSASAEILEHQGGLPKKILFTYYEENKIMSLELKDAQMNVPIDSTKWERPNTQPQINMGEQAAASMVQYPE